MRVLVMEAVLHEVWIRDSDVEEGRWASLVLE